jgi:hypothetical protein
LSQPHSPTILLGMTKKVVSLPGRMTPDQFEALVRDRARFSHEVRFTHHATEQMTAREITRTMVLRALRKGTVNGAKLKFDPAHQSWVAPMSVITAGVEVTAICAVEAGNVVVTVITAVGKSGGRK